MPICPRCGKLVKNLKRHTPRCGRRRTPIPRRQMPQPYYLGFNP